MIDWLGEAGIKLAWLVFGAVGALLGISYTPAMTSRQMIAALLAGISCASLAPQGVLAVWPSLPPFAQGAIAFAFGIGGMYIVPGLLALWRAFAENPWSAIDRMRGNRPQPVPPSRPVDGNGS